MSCCFRTAEGRLGGSGKDRTEPGPPLGAEMCLINEKLMKLVTGDLIS